ncbi:MAG: hypothetical protein DRN91_07120 [Candidatus Alkanophagales archaeon]|nr:MAG: hypothetical protein DRN91_07120 [Candidatus Alkanophagales archaeon]
MNRFYFPQNLIHPHRQLNQLLAHLIQALSSIVILLSKQSDQNDVHLIPLHLPPRNYVYQFVAHGWGEGGNQLSQHVIHAHHLR